MGLQTIYNEAVAAGKKAVTDVLGGEYVFNPNKFEPCGFAWVIIKGDRTGFAKWLVDQGYASKNYAGPGISIWIGAYNQSVDCKYLHAEAMAKVFREYGYNAVAHQRLD